jgi:hypothetical protein
VSVSFSGVEQREAAQREAPGAVRRARAAHFHRHVPARAQGQQGVGAGNPRRFKEFNYEDYRKLRLSTDERAGEALARLAA